MTGQHHGAWAEYAREQRALRSRETRARADVSGDEALDAILDAIAAGRGPLPGEARRARLTAERRERDNDALRVRHAAGHEDDLRRRDVGPERLALFRAALDRLPERTARAIALDAQGYDGREVSVRIGLSEDAVRQCLSRAARRLAA